MANNCLQTKLKSSVQNDNLAILGTLTVKTSEGGNCIIKPIDGKSVTVTKRSDGTEIVVTTNRTVVMNANSVYDISSVYDILRIGFSGMYIEKIIGLGSLINNEFFYAPKNWSVADFAELPVGGIRYLSLEHTNSVNSKEEILRFFKSMSRVKDIIFNNCNPKFTTKEIGSLGWFTYERGFLNITHSSMYGAIEDLVAAERKQGVSSATVDLDPTVKGNNITFNGSSIPAASGYNVLSWAPNSSVSSNTDITLDGVTITIDANGEKVG